MHPRHRTWRVRGIPAGYDQKTLAEALQNNEDLQIQKADADIIRTLRNHLSLLQGLLAHPDIIQTTETNPGFLKTLRTHPYLPQAILRYSDLLEVLKAPSGMGIFNAHPYLLELISTHPSITKILEAPPDLEPLRSHPHQSHLLRTLCELLEVEKWTDLLTALRTFPHLLDTASKASDDHGGDVINGVEVYTLASDLEGHQVATVRFACIPTALARLKKEGQLRTVLPSDDVGAGPGGKRVRGPEIGIDEKFDGMTILHSPPQNEHRIDVIAIPGLGGHSFGSFTNKEDGHMWLCKSLPRDMPGARVIIYGYDSVLHNSSSFASLYDYSASLQPSLSSILGSNTRKPLLLLGHSLGGLVIKETLIQLARPGLEPINTNCGLVFFGVPNNGLQTDSLVAMVRNQPNRQFLESLSPNSAVLSDQRVAFASVCQQWDLKPFCFYETQESPTAVQDTTTGKFTMSGPKDCLVDIPSATSCLSPDMRRANSLPIHRPHSELVKFSHGDEEYKKVVDCIKRVAEGLTKLSRNTEPKNTDGTLICSLASQEDSIEEDAVAEARILSGAERKQLLDSLEFEQIDARHQTIKEAHIKTCAWLLDKPEYVDWCNAKKLPEHRGFLWIKGKPGTGKSTLMKFCVSKARERMRRTVLISFFFHARGHDLEKSTEGMYRSMLFQLLRRFPSLLNVFDTLGLVSLHLERHKWNVESLKTLFKTAVQGLRGKGTSLVCFIDALDECPEPQIRDMASFFEQMGEVAISAGVKFHVCFSSRHYPHITVTNGLSLVLEVQEGHQNDIKEYIFSELKIEDKALSEHLHNESSTAQETLAAHVRQELQEKASGIFMWIVLVVDILNREFDGGHIDMLRQKIRELPAELHELFRDILQRDEKNRLGLRLCVQWVLFARQPLQPRQLYCAIKSGADTRSSPAIDGTMEEKDVRKFILDSSKGLTEFTASDSPTVQFIHESVRDFFLKEGGSREIWPELEEDFQGASHERLKQCCLAQMEHAWTDLQNGYATLPSKGTAKRRTKRAAESPAVEHPEAELPDPKSPDVVSFRQTAASKFPFLKYALQNVLFHADLAQKYGVRQTDFLLGFQLPEWVKQDNLFAESSARQHTLEASLLYILAEQNLANLIAIHPSKLKWLEIGSERCGPPILAALASKSYKAVETLLEAQSELYPEDSRLRTLWRHYSPNLKLRSDFKFSSQTSVSSPIINVGEDIILEYIAFTDKYDISDADLLGNSLLMSAKQGKTKFTQFLLEKGASIEATDSEKRTPLWWASSKGHEALARFLIEKGANVEAADSSGRTPLLWAAERGYEDVVRLLLEKGANVEAADSSGRTPLSWAIEKGRTIVVELLKQASRAG